MHLRACAHIMPSQQAESTSHGTSSPSAGTVSSLTSRMLPDGTMVPMGFARHTVSVCAAAAACDPIPGCQTCHCMLFVIRLEMRLT